MSKWMEIVKDITDIPLSYASDPVGELLMEVELDPREEWIKRHSVEKAGAEVRDISLDPQDEIDLFELSIQLHQAMKEYTGGDLRKYIVRIDETGKATASFEYHDPETADAD